MLTKLFSHNVHSSHLGFLKIQIAIETRFKHTYKLTFLMAFLDTLGASPSHYFFSYTFFVFFSGCILCSISLFFFLVDAFYAPSHYFFLILTMSHTLSEWIQLRSKLTYTQLTQDTSYNKYKFSFFTICIHIYIFFIFSSIIEKLVFHIIAIVSLKLPKSISP